MVLLSGRTDVTYGSCGASSILDLPVLLSPMSIRRKWLILIGALLFLVARQLRSSNTTPLPSGFNSVLVSWRNKNDGDDDDGPTSSVLSIRPGDLPSYTGWGRSETTLAPFFQIKSTTSSRTTLTSGIKFRMQCRLSSLCATASPDFYVRAYGPSIIAGHVNRVDGSNSEYEVILKPTDPGSYLIEVVLTFSNFPDVHLYPLKDAAAYRQFLYEGYHVGGSPFQVVVSGEAAPQPRDLPLCRTHELVSTNSYPPFDQARWKVVDVVNHPQHQNFNSMPKNVTLQGYQNSLNSIGLKLDYQFKDCRLMPEPTPKANIFQCVREPIHIILIGDSVFRLQERLLKYFVAFNDNIKVSSIELYGGYFKTQMLTGPNVKAFLKQAAQSPERRVILFNTGLHDIHTLCGGGEMAQDRQTYLRSDMPTSCVDLYEMAIATLVDDIMEMPETDIKIFQTTTAAWSKYGNYGVAWDPRFGQPLPLDASFIKHFNDLALGILRKFPSIHVVDGFHVSYSRPDHREIDHKSNIGKKLSHPGVEVISAMLRIWSMVFLQEVCA